MTLSSFKHLRKSRGFTIVELIIVIVVIGVLASITVVGYGIVQQRARDVQRMADVKKVADALELYYLENRTYPTGSGSTNINASWSTTSDGSWSNLLTQLAPFATDLPTKDPKNTPNTNVLSSGYNYAYFSGSYCGVTNRQMYIIVFRKEDGTRSDTLKGDCTTNALYYSGTPPASNHRIVRQPF